MLVLAFLIFQNMFAQTKSFDVARTSFSTQTNDEFSPVYYKNGIVFCSNLKNNSLVTYENDRKKLYNIFYVPKRGKNSWSGVRLLSKELTSNYNEGPGSFTETGDTFYFCRNTSSRTFLKDNSNADNKLGIYSSEYIGKEWTNIKPFAYNSSSYSLVTPALTADGKRLYFASDMPGGFGEADLYYCDWKNNAWDKPVNMGPAINTSKNESYPFASKSGKLFFASEGHDGFGGKDIFYTQEVNGHWIQPVHLDSDINSAADDFGIVTDEDFTSGYFSSNRRKSDDIYSFTASPVEFPVCDTLLKNNYCFLFYDEFQVKNDTAPVRYEWDFGNGIKKYGLQVKYCFPGPGKYEVQLNLLDAIKTDSIHSRTSYNFELEDENKTNINAPDAGVVNEAISFDGLKTNLPDFRISDYLWNLGDGFVIRGPVVKKVFEKPGEYPVQLGLLGDRDTLGNIAKACICKKIIIYNDFEELAMHNSKEISELDYFTAIEKQNQLKAGTRKQANTKNNNAVAKGLNSSEIKIYLFNSLSEVQKDKIVSKLFSAQGSSIEINDTGIGTSSMDVLAKFIQVLNENPDLKLEITVHTGEKGSTKSNLEITETKAREINSYFLKNGISAGTIHCKGYGESHPGSKSANGAGNPDNRTEFIFLPN